jgi:hypothetical protein
MGILRQYRDSIISTIIILACVVYPFMAMQFNPPPAKGAGEIVRGIVTHAQRDHPHIQIQLPNGEIQALDFPGSMLGIYMAKYQKFAGVSPKEFELLKGCNAEIQIDHWRGYLITTIPRIWSLKCDGISFTYEAMTTKYQSDTEFGIIMALVFAACFAGLVICIYGDFIKNVKNGVHK